MKMKIEIEIPDEIFEIAKNHIDDMIIEEQGTLLPNGEVLVRRWEFKKKNLLNGKWGE